MSKGRKSQMLMIVAGAVLLAPLVALADDANGNVRYIGDGTVTLGDGTRYKIPEGSNIPPLKEGQHVTIQFKKAHDRNEITHMRVDD